METVALVSQAAGPIMGAMGARQQAKAQQDADNRNAFIARTRAIQTDIGARQGLESELGSMRAALGANGQPMNAGTFELFQDFRKTRDRERSIEFGNRMMEAADFRTKARNSGQMAKMALPVGLAKAGQPLFDLYELLR